MELTSIPTNEPVRSAASIVMLRDGDDGLEVFMVQRHGLSDVLGGAYVFPGGKVDAADALEAAHARLDLPATALRERLAEPCLDEAQAAALYVAAVREACEEAGVLYASDTGPAQAEAAARELRVNRAFEEVMATLGLRIAASALLPWSRWITPLVGGVIRKRFDTRFFLAALPAGQAAHHDGHEASDSAWLAPRAALRLYWAGEIALAPPQIMSLAHLARHKDVASALSEARARKPPLIEPHAIAEGEGRLICYPGDERHAVREPAWPGPTRLHHRGGRFEPDGGFEGFFALD
jgi:8-oxo-dGTP pyrophosphatase MutT (NUDIX family)